MIAKLTLQESFADWPAHSIDSIMPPGAADPYFLLHSPLVQIGRFTSCKIEGCGPSEKKRGSFKIPYTISE